MFKFSNYSILIFALAISIFSVAPEAMAEEMDAVKGCLKGWVKHPFNAKNPKYKKIKAKVKVLGIGSGGVKDREKTKKPRLVYLKPNVSVMSKNVMDLMNPNGWYCLKGNVGVMAKTVINIHCDAKLAMVSDGGVNVLGSNDDDVGVTVLGKTKVRRLCDKD